MPCATELKIIYSRHITTFNLGQGLVARLLVASNNLARVQAHLQQLLGLVQQLARERDQKVCAVTDLEVMHNAAVEQNTNSPTRAGEAKMHVMPSASSHDVYLRLLLLAGKYQHLCGGMLHVWWTRINWSD